MPLDLLNFVRKWNASTLTEKSAAPQHFRDLCEVLEVPHPTQEDEIGASYTFEKRVTKTGSTEEGFADVWKRGFFAWEYKSKGADLLKAYRQLNEYHEALLNPPLLVVCDFVRFEVHTKFENLPTRTYKFTLDDLLVNSDTAECAIPPLEVLRHIFGDFNQLRPGVAAIRVTKAAAGDFLRLARQLELEKAAAPQPFTKQQIAHFLMRLVFCLFADSVGLLPSHAFRNLVQNQRYSPINFNRILPTLFAAMSQENAFFGADVIPFFNGGLFSDDTTIPLNQADLRILHAAAQHDWAYIEPVIFGTLFERSLDADKRSMIGAHYTSPEDILLLIEPVVIAPLQRRWQVVRQSVLDELAREPDGRTSVTARLKLQRAALDLLQNWATELTRVRILDPACGSGNFLYIALKRLLDLWQEARVFGLKHGLSLTLDPIPNPAQLFGIEIDFYAHEIASIVVWIGFLQWKHDHSVKEVKSPVLEKLTNIQHDDAIMRYDAEGKPYEPEWPAADFIVGNPPFLGDKKMRAELNIAPHPRYVDDLRELYKERIPGGADLVTYWFEKARAMIEAKQLSRAGLLATNSIRMVGNRPVLNRILSTGDIFMAWSDRPWTLDGAAVRVSMVGFDDGSEVERFLDGTTAGEIYADLTKGANLGSAATLAENDNLCFLGVMKGGPFDIAEEEAKKMLSRPINPNGRPNSDVIRRRLSAQDITRRNKGGWIIDFGVYMTESKAALYEWPFEYVKVHVKPIRDLNRRKRTRERWWIHGEARPGLRRATSNLPRSIVTPEVAKYRVFVWMEASVIPDHTCHVIAREDDYFFGVLHSRAHEGWSLKVGATLEDRPRYSSEKTFHTFPFPWSPNHEPKDSPLVEAIAAAARNLVQLRDAWLNPPDISEADLKKRTLTRLYNERPTWLADAHRILDEAVFAAYGWPATLTNPEILERLLALNHERAAAQTTPEKKPLPQK